MSQAVVSHDQTPASSSNKASPISELMISRTRDIDAELQETLANNRLVRERNSTSYVSQPTEGKDVSPRKLAIKSRDLSIIHAPRSSTDAKLRFVDDLEQPLSPTDSSAMTDSTDSILNDKLTLSTQALPEGRFVDQTVMSPSQDLPDSLSRESSTRSSARLPGSARPAKIPIAMRRVSRRSTSNSASKSPAHAFLSSWSKTDSDPAPEPKPDDEGQTFGLNNEYVVGALIGSGGFGVVKEAHTIDKSGSRSVWAVKIMRKHIGDADESKNERAQQDLEHEVFVWRELRHQHVLRLHAVYLTEYATFCVMDPNVGGTLYDIVRKSRASASANGGRIGLEPKLAVSYAYQLASALRYLHEDVRVCHRDVKLENCLVDMSGPKAVTEGGVLRLCDFGLADFLQSGDADDNDDADDFMAHRMSGVEMADTRRAANVDDANPRTSLIIGTLEYASPKGLSVTRKLYETYGDVWAFGIVVYALCTGKLPFRHDIPSVTAELILLADWDDTALKHAAAGSDAAIELVKGCLVRDVDERYTIGEALRNPWFEVMGDEDGVGGFDIL